MPSKCTHLVFTQREILEIIEGNEKALDDLEFMSYYKDNLVTISGYHDLEKALRATLPEDQKGFDLLMEP